MNSVKQQLLDEVSVYRDLRPGNLTSPRFRHLLLLLFWPLYFVCFWSLELWQNRDFTPIYWPAVDDAIPFCEWFVIPYLFWFVFLGGMVVFTLLFDRVAFRKMMYFIMITYLATLVVYLVFPTSQELRPDIAALGRDNLLTRFMANFYEFDTNTNVCPSIHVLGAVSVLVGSWHCKYFKSALWRIFFWVWTILICLSTVFLKQHSAVDVWPALLLCVLAYPFAFHGDKIFKRRKQ